MKNFKITFFSFFTAIFIMLCGCSGISNFVDKNPLIVDIAVRESVVRYIDQGETLELKKLRALKANAVLDKVKLFVDSGEEVKVSGIIAFTNSAIDWDSLSIPDKIIIQDILLIVQAKLNSEADLINPETVIKLNALINTAKSATLIFQ